ncbi:MAG: hypothetical protein E7012_02005 [Alphaproteobacteria bacterium]|nr:hypothetical protein [Alphaproteobacteria bacterium]
MFFNINKIITVSALAILATMATDVQAQGLVTLSEEAMFDEDDSKKAAPIEAPKTESGDDALGNIAVKPKTSSVPETKPVEKEEPTPNIVPDKNVVPVVSSEPKKSVAINDDTSSADDDEVFSKMSDLEKQTAVLNLELRKERVKNEIEALKNQRKQARQQEQDQAEEKKRKQIEWEKAQEQKILEEQQKLRELDIQFEKVRQEVLLNSYKNEMLKVNQEWIAHEASLYKQIDDLKKEKQDIYDDMKKKLTTVKNNINTIMNNSDSLIAAYKNELENKDLQISVLRARNEAQERELEKRNPFAAGATPTATSSETSPETDEIEVDELELINQYAVMEIRGQNGELIAKLINQDGMPFYVKKGTSLQSGHTITEITSTYVKAEKNGFVDYLYFAAGGILPKEQPMSPITPAGVAEEGPGAVSTTKKGPSFAASIGVPGMGKSMMAR